MAGTDPTPSRTKRAEVGIPPRVFFYTLDQISTMLNYELVAMKRYLIHYDGRSTGARKNDRLMAINIAPSGSKPEWRVSESEFIRWCKYKGVRFYERGWAQP